jgi:lipoprotein-releasing system ATP-binding protein
VDILVEGLCKTYRDASRELTILHNASLSLASGKRAAIVGRSGVGKTTLLQIIGGLARADAGKVMYGNVDICGLKDDALSRFRGASIGFVFQFHQLLPEFTALENVAMPLLIAGAQADEAFHAANQLIDLVGLQARSTHRPSELSGGEQQRIAIARALVAEPQVVLADEPTGNLDIATGNEIRELLIETCEHKGITLVVVTHSMELATNMDVVFEMQQGGVCLAR